ncbi:MAG TPA: AraC family transcriptional regulator [Puia sp.]|jgi:AraC family transcriptional activator of pobA|nr:AraC family transcriptional regulator [Puia sp.]
MNDDQIRISEFKKALQQYASDGVVDLDKNFQYKFDFQIYRYEDVFRNSRIPARPYRWSYHRICFLKQGEGEIITGIYKFKARKNTLFVIPSRVIASSKNWSADTQGYVLLFNIEFFLQNNFSYHFITNKKLLTASIQPYIYLTDDQAEEITRIFESIMFEKKLNENRNNELIAVKILEILLMGERLFEQVQSFTANFPYTDILKRFVDLLDMHFSKEHSVKFYADQLSMHPNHLNALIKKQTGISAKESIQSRIMLETKYLLHSTKLPIKQISSQMGFNDPNYFTTFFKRSENISPVNYRSNFG